MAEAHQGQAQLAAAAAAANTTDQTIEQAGQLRFVSLESLRALAAVGVVFVHVYVGVTFNVFDNVGVRTLNSLGMGALFLFTLSGCLIYLPFAKRDFGGSKRKIPLGNYAWNRMLRVFPVYYISLIVCFIVLEGGGEPWQWWRFALFLQNFDHDTLLTVNGLLWTVCVEVQFYILVPLIAWLLVKASRGSPKVAILLLAGAGLVSAAMREHYFLLNAANPSELVRFSLLSTFCYVAAGMIAAIIHVSWDQVRPSWLRGRLASSDLWFLASIPVWFLVPLSYQYKAEPVMAVASFLVLGAVIFPLGGAKRIMNVLEWRWLAGLGVASLSLYVWHEPVIRFVTDDQQNALHDHLALQLVVVFAISIAVALISYRIIETPALKRRRRWDGGRAAAAQEGARGSEPGAAGAVAVAAEQPATSR